MISFIKTVLIDLKEKKQSLEDLHFILPSKRAGVFLKHQLSTLLEQPIFSPQILSIEEFVEELSGLQSVPNTELLFRLYETYKSLTKTSDQESFDSFSKWAQILLQDFNEIDRYLVDQDSFFKYLYYINDQRHWFLQEKKTHLIEDYIQFWERLQTYYEALTSKMNEKGKGYQGHQYRMAAQNTDSFIQGARNNYLFAGFNALNNAEQHIIKSFLEEKKGQVFWDADACFLNDQDHDASLFLKRFKKEWKGANGFD